MRRILSFLFLVAMSMPLFAADEYKVTATCSDGTSFEGYTKYFPYENCTSIPIRTESGEYKKYSSDEIVTLEYSPFGEHTQPLVYKSVVTQKTMPTLFSKDPKPYKKPIFLRQIYSGERVDGYVMLITGRTNTPSVKHTTYNIPLYFYKVHDDEKARQYLLGELSVGLGASLKLCFKKYPKMVEKFKSKEIKADDVYKNPLMIFPIFDSILENNF